MLNPEPVYLELDKKREVAYTVGSALILRENGFEARPLVERIEDDDAGHARHKIYHDSVVAWLVACLQREARHTGDVLDEDWAKDQLDSEEKLLAAIFAINRAVARYRGVSPGGEKPARRAPQPAKRATRSR